MKDLFIDCQLGLSGDMLLSALIDLGVPKSIVDKSMRQIPLLIDYELIFSENKTHGFRGITLLSKKEIESVHLNSWNKIKNVINQSGLEEDIRIPALEIYKLLAESEAEVHGTTYEKVHFHEIGSIETLIEVVGICSAFNYLKPTKIYSMIPPSGSGNVQTIHGILPIPVPCVMAIASRHSIKLVGGNNYLSGEVTTPTGLAAICIFADKFKQPGNLDIISIGVGIGNKEFGRPNFLRICELSSCVNDNYKLVEGIYSDDVLCQEAWIDDASPEDLAILINQLRKSGAIEVISHSIQMKKARQGFSVKALVSKKKSIELRRVWFSFGSTLGFRETTISRWVLPRRIGYIETPFGKVLAKEIKKPDGSLLVKPEHDELIRLCEKTGKSLQEIRKEIFISLDKFTSVEDWSF